MNSDSKIPLNYPPQESPPPLPYKVTFHYFIVEGLVLYKGDYYITLSSVEHVKNEKIMISVKIVEHEKY